MNLHSEQAPSNTLTMGAGKGAAETTAATEPVRRPGPLPSNERLTGLEACQWIVELFVWDKDVDGERDPKPPYSWETCARMAGDYARGALRDATPEPPQASNDLLAEAAKFIDGFAASGEAGFAHQRKALDWMMRYRSYCMLPTAHEPPRGVERSEQGKFVDYSTFQVVSDSHGWLYREKQRLESALARAAQPPNRHTAYEPPQASNTLLDTWNAWLKDAESLIESGVATDMIAVCPVALRRLCTEAIARASHEPPADEVVAVNGVDVRLPHIAAVEIKWLRAELEKSTSQPPVASALSFGQVVTDGQIVAIYSGEDAQGFNLLRMGGTGALYEVRRPRDLISSFRPATWEEMHACPHGWLTESACEYCCGATQPPIDARVHPDTRLIDSLRMRSTLNDMAARADSAKVANDV